MVGFSTHDLLEGAPGSHSVGQSPGIISSVGTPASSVEVEVFHFPTAVPHVGFSNDVIGVGINGSAEFVPIPLPMIMPISSRLQFIPDDASIPLRKGILSTPESHSKVAPKKYSTVSTPSATISGGSRDRKISCRSLKNDVCKSESPVVRFAPDRPTSATEKSLVDSPESDSPGDNQGFDSTEDDTISTSSSYVSGSPDDLKPERQMSTRRRKFSGRGMEEGADPTKFADLAVHVDDLLPPVAVIEDAENAARMPDDIPIIDTLVVDGVVVGKEKMKTLAIQIFIPFLLAGFGMVGAGILLDAAQNWPVFVEISELLIMVPALLGLKGNLEMTLASRLSTQVNIGGFEDPRRKWKIIGCNVALNQVLATGVGFLVSMFAVAMYAINHGGRVATQNVVLMLGTALVSACATSVVQDSAMIGIVLFARRFRINPDNIATPVAATIGDVLTLSILAGFSFLFYSAFNTSIWMVGPVVIICTLAGLFPMWVWLAGKEPTTRHVLLHGWMPVIIAMLISSCSGVILERVVNTGYDYFKDLPVFQPLINGVGGNIVSVQASRIATYLHLAYSVPGHVPPGYAFCRSPCYTFCSRSNINSRTARLLLLMVVPGHLIFLFTISFADPGSATLTLRFAFVFLIMALIQIIMLLYIADTLTHLVWKRALDPDSQTIPYLTALGDLSGTGLLALGFWLLHITTDHSGATLNAANGNYSNGPSNWSTNSTYGVAS